MPYHYGRGVAFAKKGLNEKALVERGELQQLITDNTLKSISVGALNSPYAIMAIAEKVLSAEIANAKKDFITSASILKQAIEMEDALNYNEPADWHHPVRQILGALLLKTGKAAEAEKLYREDLKVYPENGWSLYGLQQSLLKQNKADEAKSIKIKFEKAFTFADVKLTESSF